MALLQPRLNLRVSQRQVLTPGLMQMVSVLALNKLELKEKLFFDWDKATLDKESYETLDEVAQVLNEEGFTPGADLLADITEALKTMHVYKDTYRGPKSCYYSIKRRDILDVVTKHPQTHLPISTEIDEFDLENARRGTLPH